MQQSESKRGTSPSSRAASQWALVLGIGGLLGAWLGTFYFSTWQAALETAQVHAGVVEYPPNNPFNHYHLEAWSLFHQVLAPLLAVGISERAISVALSAILLAVLFMILASITYILSGNVALSPVAPLSLLMLYVTYNMHGPVYPLALTGSYHTYGIAGRALALSALVALAAGKYRLGGLLVGLGPGIHLTWGTWAGGVGVLALAWDFRVSRIHIKPLMQGAAVGAVVTVASFIHQSTLSQGLPKIPPEERQRYLEAYTTFDMHREAVWFMTPGPAMALATTVLSGLALWRLRAALSGSQQFLLRAMFLAGALSFAAAGLTLLPSLPPLVHRLMPGRFMNLPILALPAVLLGLLGWRRDRPSKLLLFFHVLYAPASALFLHATGRAWGAWWNSHWIEFVSVSCVLAIILLIAPLASRQRNPIGVALPASALVLLLAIAPWHFERMQPFRYPYSPLMPLLGSAPDPALDAARNDQGLLLVAADIQFGQLMTRRPLVISSALGQLPYVPDSGPAMARILKDVYDLDLFQAPPNAPTARLALQHFRNHTNEVWASRTEDEWRAIRQTYGASQVMTRAGLNLSLTKVAESETYVLYSIPRSGRPARPRPPDASGRRGQ